MPFDDLRRQKVGTASMIMREQVVATRRRQAERFGDHRNMLNGRMGSRLVREQCPLDSACEQLLKQAMTELGLSARAHDKLLRLARTIADIEGKPDIAAEHLSEAVQYRRLDRQL